MTYQNFKKVVDLMIKHTNRINKLYKLGLDSYEIFDEHDRIINALWKEVLTDEGYDWLSWYLYEKNGISGKPKKYLEATEKDGTEICYNLISTYKFLLKEGHFKTIVK